MSETYGTARATAPPTGDARPSAAEVRRLLDAELSLPSRLPRRVTPAESGRRGSLCARADPAGNLPQPN